MLPYETNNIYWLAGNNGQIFNMFKKLQEKQKTSIKLNDKASNCLSGLPSQLPYESPMFPLFIKNSQGPYIWDVDNNQYIDCHSCYTATILGHNHPNVMKKFQQGMEHNRGAAHATEEHIQLAELIQKMIPQTERVAYFHTGGEAILTATRLARNITKKKLIAKFEGCYHGSTDIGLHNPWLALAGQISKDPLQNIQPKYATGGGVTHEDEYLILPYNTNIAFDLIQQYKNELACIVADPVPAFMVNWVDECKTFMKKLCQTADKFQIPMIFDEIVCGFRLAKGGAREWLQYKPAMSCFGKITSSLGLPLSILAGDAKYLDNMRTSGVMSDYGMNKVWAASTMNANYPSVLASLAQLQELDETYDTVVQQLDKNHAYLKQQLAQLAQETNIAISLEGHPRLQQQLSIDKQHPEEKTYRSLMTSSSMTQFKTLLLLTYYLRNQGVYTKLLPTMNLSSAHNDQTMQQLFIYIKNAILQMKKDNAINSINS
ncbi:MAG TPA: aminotransferase class III-fold pyridoxal phosphate-dependent enzyme [Planctomycetota bacterium]|nr:aminotransferase class III-fold pyridoxal phosphate-dependent enzyme [Planctomycetota bacterium]HQB01568.1 aminotransferase class III-fold pyridoxal phosphate-dependent enzyme [Planctomycetota bacterium]